MSTLLITHIKGLIGTHSSDVKVLRGQAMSHLPQIDDAWLLIEDGLIKDFGKMASIPSPVSSLQSQISIKGKFILPAWCDSHTHLVFAASREEEFVMKIRGQSYEEIAAAGGGILNSARKVQQASEGELFDSAFLRLEEVVRLGTGAIEIKSGYGLTVASELKMLRVIRRLKEAAAIPVKATFLGAHAYPESFKNDHEGYIKLLVDELIPQIAGEGLADYIDAFCEQGFFSLDETARILEAGAKYGLKAKIHANQLSASGAVETGVKHGALSVDHLEVMDDAALHSLSHSDTIASLLPSCSLFLGIPFANARSMIEQNIPVAIASDFNPGSTPSGNMNLVVSLACMRLKMLPEQAINAATINGAAAMELSGSHGSITRGKVANFIITKPIPSLPYLPYSFGSNHIESVFINGKVF
ncbi:MAG TPA: imidazolonepropionase [Daejeonella sp.]|nr:imidazolonepropionase [Daejeonella sp.]